jgi:hypothetical protein
VLRESLGVLALGKLSVGEGRPIMAHADECPECGAELDDLLEVTALLRPAPEPVARVSSFTRAQVS